MSYCLFSFDFCLYVVTIFMLFVIFNHLKLHRHAGSFSTGWAVFPRGKICYQGKLPDFSKKSARDQRFLSNSSRERVAAPNLTPWLERLWETLYWHSDFQIARLSNGFSRRQTLAHWLTGSLPNRYVNSVTYSLSQNAVFNPWFVWHALDQISASM